VSGKLVCCIMLLNIVTVCRLDVRENDRRKVCVRGLLENKVHDTKSLVQVVTLRALLHTQVNW